MTIPPAITNPGGMAVPEIPGLPLESLPWPAVALVDDMQALYMDWLVDAEAAADAYERWCSAPAVEQAIAYSAYVAGLDQEQAAASEYAVAVAELEHWLETTTTHSTNPRRRKS
jgi:hypothetical protein